MKRKRVAKLGRVRVLCAQSRKSREQVIVGRGADRRRIMISVFHKPQLNELRRGKFMAHELTARPAMGGGMVIKRLALTVPEATMLLRLLSDVLFQLIVERRQLAK